MIARIKGYPIKIVHARERVDRAPPAARGLRRRDHRLAGRRGLQRRRAPGARARRRAPRVGVPLPVRQRGQPPGALRDAPAPRSGPTAPRSPTSWPASAPRGTLMGVGTFLKEQNPDVKVMRGRAAARASRSRASATSTRATSRRFTRSGAATSCSTASAIVRPRESHRVAPAAWPSSAASSPASPPAPPWPGPRKVAARDRDGHDRVRRVRRRLEVPLHRRLDRRHRRGRRPGREDHLLLSAVGAPWRPVAAGVPSERGSAPHRDVRQRVRRAHRGAGR